MKRLIFIAFVLIGSVVASAQSSSAQQAEVSELRQQASQITKQIGDLAASGSLPANDESIALLKELVAKLDEINQRLRRLETAISSEQKSEAPKPKSALDRFTPSLSIQFQYRDSDRQTASPSSSSQFFGVPYSGNREHGMTFRRVRVGGVYEIDRLTSFRLGIEVANGTTSDQSQLREARLIKTLDPKTKISVGQFPLPFGYENARSSTDREFPEFAQYNRALASGEAFRGGMIQYSLSKNVMASVGLFGSLALNDPEQLSRPSMASGRASGYASIRYTTKQVDLGFSAIAGERPSFKTSGTPSTVMVDSVVVVTPGVPVVAPSVKRELFAVDATVSPFLITGLTLRSELVWGRDRLPISAATNSTGLADGPRTSGHPVLGWQTQLSWAPDAQWVIFGRLESFDPDTLSAANTVTGSGVGIRRKITGNEQLSLTFEHFRIPQFSVRRGNNVLTLRYQVRF